MFLIRLVHPLFTPTAEPQDRRWLKLAEARFVLEHLYGESSLIYDDYKGSFAFPCALDVIKAETTVFPYLVNFRDHRGWLEFSLRKCVGSERQADTHIHQPFEAEFSRKEINTFVAYFYGYLLGRLKALLAAGNRPLPFIRRIDSNLILYGYCDGKFFEQSYDEREKFEEAYRRLEARLHGGFIAEQ